MTIVSIDKIKSLRDVLTYCEQLDQISDEVLIDFSNAEFIYSNFTALLGAYIYYLESKNIKVVINRPIKGEVYTTLCKNNFLPFFNSEYSKMNDKTLTTIEFRQFDIADTMKQQHFSDLLRDGLLKSRGLVNLSDKVLKEVSRNVIELFSNSVSHSQSACGMFCAGQLFPNLHKLDVTIVDMGVGIHHNVVSYLGREMDADEAIRWAMERLNSTRGDIGGLGLALLKELITLTRGKLEIVSNNGYYFIKNGKEGSELLNFIFPGTAVNIEFKIDDKYYFLKGEIE